MIERTEGAPANPRSTRRPPVLSAVCGVLFPAAIVWLATGLARAGEMPAPPAGPVNLAPFGRVFVASVDGAAPGANVGFLASETNALAVRLAPGAALQIEWDHPRPVRRVALCGVEGEAPPEAAGFEVQWWRRIWPDNGTGGWMKLDDPFNGAWTAGRVITNTLSPCLELEFAPLTDVEAPGIERRGMPERQTYKLRLVPARSVSLREVRVFSDAVWRTGALRFEWNCRTTVPGRWKPTFTIRNGRLRETRDEGSQKAVVAFEYAATADPASADRALVSFRSGETRSFGVWADEVLGADGIWIRDIGVFVSDASRPLTYRDWPGPAGDVWPEGGVVDQVARMPEQSFEAARDAMPSKPPPYLFLGVPNLRQEIALLPKGQIQLCRDSLRSPGPDWDARPWLWDALIYDFASGERPVFGPDSPRQVGRTLESGWLPVVHHEWTSGDIDYAQTCLAAPLTTDIAAVASTTGTEPVVLATRFELRNRTSQPTTGWLWLELNHPIPLRLGLADTLLLDHPSRGPHRPGRVPVRGRFDRHGQGALDVAVLTAAGSGSDRVDEPAAPSAREAVRYRVAIPPGETRTLDFFVPYVELLDAAEATALGGLEYPALHESVVRFWTQRVAQSMSYEVPEPWLNNFFKANLWRVLISTDIDPVTGYRQHGAATHHYKNYLNETAMVARSLEMRGEHAEARRLIEPFLECQGARGLAGNFRTHDAVLYAAHPSEPDPYTGQAYTLHHGWGLWAAAEHYLWTRDLAYLSRVASRLVAASEWIVRERQATRRPLPDGSRRIEYGLAPAGDLEDVEEFLYYYATDAYFHIGLSQTAEVLEQSVRAIRDSPAPAAPEARAVRRQALASYQGLAARLKRDAEEFRRDIRASVAESVATSPVVRLRDGSHVPWVPPRAYALTHQREGWIREALYPALHLVSGGVYEPAHPFVDWMVRDLEDNIFLSSESGYGVARPRQQFFHLGGFTLQPALLDLPLVYLAEDRTANFLRSFYNTAAASLYPDALCFAEWMPRLGKGGGPLYKTPDECKFVQWMRQMVVCERGQTLELGPGVPRAWMRHGQSLQIRRAATHFGPLDLEIASQAAEGRITARVRLDATVRPAVIRLLLRHPEARPIRQVTIGGRPGRCDPTRQWIELPVTAATWTVVAEY